MSVIAFLPRQKIGRPHSSDPSQSHIVHDLHQLSHESTDIFIGTVKNSSSALIDYDKPASDKPTSIYEYIVTADQIIKGNIAPDQKITVRRFMYREKTIARENELDADGQYVFFTTKAHDSYVILNGGYGVADYIDPSQRLQFPTESGLAGEHFLKDIQ